MFSAVVDVAHADEAEDHQQHAPGHEQAADDPAQVEQVRRALGLALGSLISATSYQNTTVRTAAPASTEKPSSFGDSHQCAWRLMLSSVLAMP